jgi:hypothetical protein
MGGAEDDRMVFYGLRYIIETHLCRKWTVSSFFIVF